jgi:hypothetical protein
LEGGHDDDVSGVLFRMIDDVKQVQVVSIPSKTQNDPFIHEWQVTNVYDVIGRQQHHQVVFETSF